MAGSKIEGGYPSPYVITVTRSTNTEMSQGLSWCLGERACGLRAVRVRGCKRAGQRPQSKCVSQCDYLASVPFVLGNGYISDENVWLILPFGGDNAIGDLVWPVDMFKTCRKDTQLSFVS